MRSGKRGAGRFLNCNHSGTGREGGPSFRRRDASKSPNQGPRAQVRAERGARLGARLETELGTLRNEGSTKLKTWIRVVLLGILIVALGVPPGTVTSYARQQEGPVTPAPGQQPGAAPKQPTGQQQPAQAGKAQGQAPRVT